MLKYEYLLLYKKIQWLLKNDIIKKNGSSWILIKIK